MCVVCWNKKRYIVLYRLSRSLIIFSIEGRRFLSRQQRRTIPCNTTHESYLDDAPLSTEDGRHGIKPFSVQLAI